jgi:hypothetical protein
MLLFINKSNLPVFLVNSFFPLGHSGQAKLQAVVGSILTVKGFPKTRGRFSIRERIKEE